MDSVVPVVPVVPVDNQRLSDDGDDDPRYDGPCFTFSSDNSNKPKQVICNCCGEKQTCSFWPAQGCFWRCLCCKSRPEEKSAVDAVTKLLWGISATIGGSCGLIGLYLLHVSDSTIPVNETMNVSTAPAPPVDSTSSLNSTISLAIISAISVVTGVHQMCNALGEACCTVTEKKEGIV